MEPQIKDYLLIELASEKYHCWAAGTCKLVLGEALTIIASRVLATYPEGLKIIRTPNMWRIDAENGGNLNAHHPAIKFFANLFRGVIELERGSVEVSTYVKKLQEEVEGAFKKPLDSDEAESRKKRRINQGSDSSLSSFEGSPPGTSPVDETEILTNPFEELSVSSDRSSSR